MRLALPISFLFIVLFVSCSTKEEKEASLAKQYCGSCHAFPEPALLDKKSWAVVMPQMALWMGVDMAGLMSISRDDLPYVVKALPKTPLITAADFEAISNYYQREAPDSLTLLEPSASKEIDQFEVSTRQILGRRPSVTMLRADTSDKKIFIGNREGMLYQFEYNFQQVNSTRLPSAPSGMTFGKEKLISVMGIMDPNDQPKGSVGTIGADLAFHSVMDSLKRPVFIERADLNNDNLEDLIVCAFGNYGGSVVALENKGDGTYNRHEVSNQQGARKVTIKDVNGDGLVDIVVMFAQGDEQISVFTNASNFRFRITTLLKFPPIYGSSFFDITDFNKDGHWDIVYTNGDNADQTDILKPYHGIRIFLNDGKNQFSESWFHPLYGCSVALARDFDKDGDIDIATISFFPDFKNTPERSFVYFENNEGNLEPYTTPLATDGRWIVMEPLDIDADGYTDLLLGALDFNNGVPRELMMQWNQNLVDIMVLKNKGKK